MVKVVQSMNGVGDAGDALDISGPSQFDDNPAKQELLSGLHAPIDGNSDHDDDSSVLAKLQERYEDTRDALMESEPFAKIFDTTSKVANTGSLVWAFSKRAAWVVGTSALVLVVPLLYEMDKEMNTGTAPDPAQQSESGGGHSSPDSQ